MSRLAIVVIGAVCFLWIPVSEAASKCTSVQDAMRGRNWRPM